MSEAGVPAPARAQKSAAAFRTIGEVAGDLDLPAHVLRFWESKFPQLKPLKRGGGRRYYRPEDVLLLRRIRQCLYQEGYTIRGVQKLLGGPAGEAVVAPGHDDTLSLFPLDAASDDDAPPPPRPARRPRRPPAKPALDPDLRASLEDIRRELLKARALIADLLQPRKAP